MIPVYLHMLPVCLLYRCYKHRIKAFYSFWSKSIFMLFKHQTLKSMYFEIRKQNISFLQLIVLIKEE